MENKLIYSIVNRIGERLPSYLSHSSQHTSSATFSDFQLDPVIQQNVRCLVDLAPQRIVAICKALVNLFENISNGAVQVASISTVTTGSSSVAVCLSGEATEAENTQSLHFILRLVFVCLNSCWRKSSTEIILNADRPSSAKDVSHESLGSARQPAVRSSLMSTTAAELNSSPSSPTRKLKSSTGVSMVSLATVSSSASPTSSSGGRKLSDTPPVLEDKIVASLYSIATRYLESSSYADAGDALSSSEYTENGMDFASFLGLSQCDSDSLMVPVSSSMKDLRNAAYRLIFYISASNWDMVFMLFKAKLQHLAAAVDDTMEDTPELRIVEFCHLNAKKLSMVLNECGALVKLLKKNASMVLPTILRRAVWNWIELFPAEFSNLHSSQRRLEGTLILKVHFNSVGASDVLFDHYSTLADNNKKKAAIWPFQTMMLMLSPDVLQNLTGTDSDTSTSNKKIFPFTYFLESVKQALKSTRLAEVAAICYIDICRASVCVAKLGSVALNKIVPEFEKDLKDKLLQPSRPFLNSETGEIDQIIIINFFLASFRRNSELFVHTMLPVFLDESNPLTYRNIMVKSCYQIASQENIISWYPQLSAMYSTVAGPLRSLLQDCLGKYNDTVSDKRIVVGSDKKSKKKDDDVAEKQEILFNLLKLYRSDPSLALFNDKVEKYRDDTLNTLMGIVRTLRDPAIRSLAYETLINLHSPENIAKWGPSAQLAINFWTISSQVTSLVAKQVLDFYSNGYREDAIVKRHLEFLLHLLMARNEFLRSHLTTDLSTSHVSDLRQQCVSRLETTLLISLCAADPEICSISLACLQELCNESEMTPSDDGLVFLPNASQYRSFLSHSGTSGGVTGKVAQQKKIRRMLRSLEVATDGIGAAWQEGYRRWVALSPLVTKTDEHAVASSESKLPEDSKRKLFGSSKLMPHSVMRAASGAISQVVSVATSSDTSIEDKGEWQNYTGFLCALGGSCLTVTSGIPRSNTSGLMALAASDPTKHSMRISRPTSSSSEHVSDLASSSPGLDRFLNDILDILVSENAVVRESVKEIVGSELSTGLYKFFFRHLDAIMNKLFGLDGNVVSDRATFHVEQVISLLKVIIDRTQENSGDLAAVDFGSLVLAYVNYLNRLGRGLFAMRIKIKMCMLIEVLLAKRDYLSLREEIKFRNILVESLVEWTSDFSTADAHAYINEDTSLRNNKLSRDLDVMCLKSIVVLLVQLPLQPVDGLHDSDNLSDARSRLFYKYFQFFLQLMKRCRRESGETKNLSQLKDYAVLALSNLLSSNIDCGLKHALSVGYHEDSKTRTAFMQVLTNILNQGTEFDGLADSYVNDRFQKLVEIMYDPDLTLTTALVEVCPATDLDDVASLLFTIFESRNQTLRLLKTVIEMEVYRTDSAANLFRRNSIATKLITVYAKTNGTDFLHKIFEPVWAPIESENKMYEVDPAKVDDIGNVSENKENVRWATSLFLDAIFQASDAVPIALKNICAFLTASVTSAFPDAKINVVMGGFFFLRFVCPAVAAPTLNCQPGVDVRNVRRGCVLISKIIQNMSNEVAFGGKEVHMKEFNVFMSKYNDRMSLFLGGLSKWPLPDLDVAVVMNRIDETDLRKLHQVLSSSLESISRHLTTKQSVLSPKVTTEFSSSELTRQSTTDEVPNAVANIAVAANTMSLGGGVVQLNSIRKVLDTLTTLLGQLGPPAESSRREIVSVGKSISNQLYNEFMARHSSRNVDAVKEMKIFYDGGTSKDRQQLFYYIARRVQSNSLDFELVIYSILLTMKPFMSQQFAIVVDCSQFTEQNEIPSQWLNQLLQIIPLEVSENMTRVFIYNASSALKKYTKKIQRVMSSKVMRRIVFINSLNEFNEWISPMELRLPKTTVMLEQDLILSANVNLVSNIRGSFGVTLRLNAEALQLITTKKQDVLGMHVLVNDVIPLSEIDDIAATYEKGSEEEFFVKYSGSIVVLSSPKRDRIMQAILEACAKLQQRKPVNEERVIRPSDVPGTLLNMALLNMGSDDSDLRLASYSLLSLLSDIFNFDIGDQLLTAKGMLIPANSGQFITSISSRLAASEPRLTVEFLKECFVGFEKSTPESKHLCLEYMAPWLVNIAQIQDLNTGEPEEADKQIAEILRLLMELTVKEKQMFPAVQLKIWHTLGTDDEIVNLMMDPFIQYAVDQGPGSVAAEMMANTCVTLSFANVHLVSGKVVSRLRRAINDTSAKPAASLPEHGAWREISVLLRFCLMLSFNNRLYIQQFLPELFHSIVMVVASGNSRVRSTAHGLLINIVHSLCTSSLLNDKQLKALSRTLQDLSEPKFRLVFGASSNTAADVQTDVDKMPLASLEIVTLSLMEAMYQGAATLAVSTTWRARWISLATAQAFQFNPALQPRAFVELGCLCRGEMDDDLVYQIIAALRRALLYFDDTDCHLIISIIMSLSSMIESCVVESRFLRYLFWLGISIAQIGHIPLFVQAMSMIQTVLRNLNAKGYFVQESPSDFLMRARGPLDEIAVQIDHLCGVSFETDFSFSVAVIVLKGLRHPTTKTITTSTLIAFFEITCKYVYQSFYQKPSDEDATLFNAQLPGFADSSVLGYIAPLLPVVELSVFKELFMTFGVSADDLEQHSTSFINSKNGVARFGDGSTKVKYYKIVDRLSIPDSTTAVVFASLMLTALETAEYESESLFLYNFLAEIIENFPDISSHLMDRLLPRMTHILGNSNVPLVMDAVHRIIYTMSLSEDTMRPSRSSELFDTASTAAIETPQSPLRSVKTGSETSSHSHHLQASFATLTRTLTMKHGAKKKPRSPGVIQTTLSSGQSLLSPPSPLASPNITSLNPVIDVGLGGILAADCGSFANVSRYKKYAVCNHVSQLIELLLR